MTPPHPIQSIIFDFDGTLAVLTLDFGDMKRRLGAMASNYIDDFPQVDGMPALEWVQVLTRAVSDELGRETGLEFNTRCRFLIMDMELAAARRGELFPFVRTMLTDLRERGVSTAVVTRNCTPAVKTVFPEIGEYCGLPADPRGCCRGSSRIRAMYWPHCNASARPRRPRSWWGIIPWTCWEANAPEPWPPESATGAGSVRISSRRARISPPPDCLELVRILEREGLLPG